MSNEQVTKQIFMIHNIRFAPEIPDEEIPDNQPPLTVELINFHTFVTTCYLDLPSKLIVRHNTDWYLSISKEFPMAMLYSPDNPWEPSSSNYPVVLQEAQSALQSETLLLRSIGRTQEMFLTPWHLTRLSVLSNVNCNWALQENYDGIDVLVRLIGYSHHHTGCRVILKHKLAGKISHDIPPITMPTGLTRFTQGSPDWEHRQAESCTYYLDFQSPVRIAGTSYQGLAIDWTYPTGHDDYHVVFIRGTPCLMYVELNGCVILWSYHENFFESDITATPTTNSLLIDA